MQEDNDTGLQPYTEIVIANAMNDCEMQRRQTKIKWKKEELAKSESTITTYKSNIEQLEKSIQMALDCLKKIENNIDLLRNSKVMKEEFLMSMKHELKIAEKKREETKFTRNSIIDKYKNIFKSYQEKYKSLPWNQKNYELQTAIEIEKIHLNVLKTEYFEFKKKISLFNAINDERVIVAIVNLAKNVCIRNNLQKDIKSINREKIEFENKITALKNEKDIIKEQINLKVQAAVAEAKERAIKAQTNVGAPKPALPVPATSLKKSIFSRLSINGPITLKRPSVSISSLPEKSSRHLDIHIPLPQYPWKQLDKISDISKEKPDMPKTLTPNREGGKDAMETEKETSHSLEQSAPNENSITSLQKSTPEPAPEVCPSPRSPLSDRNDSRKEDLGKNKKTIKRKVQIADGPPVEISEEAPDKIPKFSTEKSCNEEDKLVQSKPQIQEEKVAEVQILESELADNEDQLTVNEDQDRNTHNIEISPDKNETVASEDPGNLADTSMDNDSVLSLNFGITNRDELNELVSRNVESPDFFIQRPGGFCFSPPFGKSTSPNKSNKAEPDFMNTMSPLFNEDKTKKTGGQKSSFDFFGTSSPKKNDNSTKSFFQLFG